ncbi:putative transcriptional regulatory protein NarL [Methylobacterium haplocladii]|nr:putative transcriptional regulatory protein NarL [Methylobacterium haplocladii]
MQTARANEMMSASHGDMLPTGEGIDARPEGVALQLLIVDDHPLFREALASAIHLAFPHANLLEADGIRAACDVLARTPAIDLTLLDLSMQGVTGFDGLVTIRTRFPRIPILIVSGLEEPRIMREALHHGAAGFVPKAVDKATLTRAISEVMNGALFMPPNLAGIPETTPARARKTPLADRIALLTPQQMRVLMMIRQGKLNKQIAHELQVGDSTVKAHVSEILRKLEVISRTQIVIETAYLDFDQSNGSFVAG